MIGFQKSDNKRVGIDIGSFSVKVVGLTGGLLSKTRALSYAIEHLPYHATAAQISESIKKAFKKADIAVPKVNISVSGPEVIFRYLQIPLMRKSEILDTLKLEWDRYISFKLDEVIWDFQILGILNDLSKGKQRLILLVAVRKDFLEQQMRLLKDAGLDAEIIDTNVTSLVNAFNFFQPDKTKASLFALMNIGESVTNLIILKNGLPRFSRDILFGGRDITYLIAQKKRIEFLEAQELKHNFKGNDEEILSTMKNGLGNLTNEIILSFEYLKQELEGEIKTIYLSGGTSNLYGIKEILSQGLGIEIEKWRLPQNLQLEQKNSKKDLEEYFPELIVALGLSLAK